MKKNTHKEVKFKNKLENKVLVDIELKILVCMRVICGNLVEEEGIKTTLLTVLMRSREKKRAYSSSASSCYLMKLNNRQPLLLLFSCVYTKCAM